MAFEKGQRLSLLVEAGSARYAIDATHVLEVSPPDASGGETSSTCVASIAYRAEPASTSSDRR